MVRPSTADDLRGRRDAQADRRRRDMADVEMDAEALMAGRQQVLDRRERCGLDQVDHHRRRQHGDAARADKRRGLVGRDDGFGGAGETGRDAGEVGHGRMMAADMAALNRVAVGWVRRAAP